MNSADKAWQPYSSNLIASTTETKMPNILLIAEIANAHEGRIADAIEMVKQAAAAGCDAIKFQKYYAREMLAPDHKRIPMFEAWEWENSTWCELIETAKASDLKVFIDIF